MKRLESCLALVFLASSFTTFLVFRLADDELLGAARRVRDSSLEHDPEGYNDLAAFVAASQIADLRDHHQQAALKLLGDAEENNPPLPATLDHDNNPVKNKNATKNFILPLQQSKTNNTDNHTTRNNDDSNSNKSQKAFIIVGAVRTLPYTHAALLANVLHPICPPETCIAHLFLHLSDTDNRPDVQSNDPTGEVVVINSSTSTTTRNQNTTAFFWQDANETMGNNHIHKYLVVHTVPPYNIGSAAEQTALDTLIREVAAPEARHKLQILRVGDPRRFSMWAARAWAWRHVLQESNNRDMHFDFFAFLRPDLLWYMPVPSFFADATPPPDNIITSPGKKEETDEVIWFHDTYFAMLPDTFMLTYSQSAAHKYFSLSHLAPAACLGGPNFNATLVQARLRSLNITTQRRDWCVNNGTGPAGRGFSEVILGVKLRLARIPHRLLPFGVTLLRPPYFPVCQPLHLRMYKVAWPFTFVPPMACEVLDQIVRHATTTTANTGNNANQDEQRLLAPQELSALVLQNDNNNNNNNASSWKPYRLRHRTKDNVCLEREGSRRFTEAPCQMPYRPNQLFSDGGGAISDNMDGTVQPFGYRGGRINGRLEKLDPLVFQTYIIRNRQWMREPCELYHTALLKDCKPKLDGECNELDKEVHSIIDA